MRFQSFVFKLLNLSKSSTVFLTIFVTLLTGSIKTMNGEGRLQNLDERVVKRSIVSDVIRREVVGSADTKVIICEFPGGIITYGPPNEGVMPKNIFKTYEDARQYAAAAAQQNAVIAYHRSHLGMSSYRSMQRDCSSPDYTASSDFNR